MRGKRSALLFLIFWLVLVGLKCPAQTLRIGTYNLADKPANAVDDQNLRQILAAIGSVETFGHAAPLDLLGFQEGPASSGAYSFLESDFEAVFDGEFDAIISMADPAGDRTGFVYNVGKLNLLGTQNLSAGLTHNILRGRFRPVGGSAADEFFVYSIHLKAGFADAAAREAEAIVLRENADSLPPGANIIYLGDFNIRGSDEGAWMQFTSTGNGQAVDTINSPFGLRFNVRWNDSLAMIPFQTQDAVADMDDRFDIIIFSNSLQNDVDLEYIDGSIRVLGNNGTHALGSSISTGSGAAGFIDNLIDFSDHLPVFADFRFQAAPDSFDQTFSREALDNETVQPAGPRQGAAGENFFNIEGDENGTFASFGVVDFDLSGVVADGMTAAAAGNVSLQFSQSNASFTTNGPISFYLASESAADVPIDGSIRYQSGNNMLACVPTVLSDGAIHLNTFAFFGRDNNGNIFPVGTLDRVALNANELEERLLAALNGNGVFRLFVTPDHGSTAATYAGFANSGVEGPTLIFDFEIQPVSKQIPPNAFVVIRGIQTGGDLSSVIASDESYMMFEPGITLSPAEPPVWLEFRSTSLTADPSTLSFAIEAAANTTGLVQRIEVFDYGVGAWQLADTRVASTADVTTTVVLAGDLSRFIFDESGEMKARVSWKAEGPVFLFPWTIRLDQVQWIVGP
jgi:hypothetical protein